MSDSLIVVSAVLGYIVFWVVLTYLMSLAGWGLFARTYPVAVKVEGDAFRWCSCTFGRMMNYNNGLDVVLCESGIYVAMFAHLFVGHRPFLIPWQAITSVAPRTGWGAKGIVLTSELENKRFRLYLPDRAEGVVREHLAGIHTSTPT